MSAGLFGLLDDIAALARLAAASLDDVGAAAARASVKAAGVVVDDTAVTPQYVTGVAAERELPIVRRIAVGSLRNKLLIILPVALLLSQFADGLLTPLLMAGGTYLCFEGAEKIWERLRGHHPTAAEDEATVAGAAEAEEATVAGAIRTDLILSAEIMVIALHEVTHEPFVARAMILAVVAVAITVLVYGVVALIVKMDDVGLHLARRGTERDAALLTAIGRGLVRGMPVVLSVLATVGVVAMLWVGGHILLAGTHDLGWHPPYDAVHHLEHGLPGVLAWLVGTVAAALVGLVVGALAVTLMHLVPRRGTGH
jgi:predicted DNA repair protein MutK